MNDSTATRLGNLFRELQKSSGGSLRDGLPRALPSSAQKAAQDPARLIDEFIVVDPVPGSKISRAWDKVAGRWVALKLWPAGTREPIEHVEVQHASAVTIRRVAESSGRVYVVTDWVEGASLDRMKPTARIAVEAAFIAAQVVHHVRRRSIATRALTPADLMIDRRGAIRVLNVTLGDDPDPAAGLKALAVHLTGNRDFARLPGATPEHVAEALGRVLDGCETKGVLAKLGAWLKAGGR